MRPRLNFITMCQGSGYRRSESGSGRLCCYNGSIAVGRNPALHRLIAETQWLGKPNRETDHGMIGIQGRLEGLRRCGRGVVLECQR